MTDNNPASRLPHGVTLRTLLTVCLGILLMFAISHSVAEADNPPAPANNLADAHLLDWNEYAADFGPDHPDFPFFSFDNIANTGVDMTVLVDPRVPRGLNIDSFDWQEPYFGTTNVFRYWPTGNPAQGPFTTNFAFSEDVKIRRLATYARYDRGDGRIAAVIELYDGVLPDGTCTGNKLNPASFTTPDASVEDYRSRDGETAPVSLPTTMLVNDSTDSGEAAVEYGDFSDPLEVTHPEFGYDSTDYHGVFAVGTGRNGNRRTVVTVDYGGTLTRCIQWHIFYYDNATPGEGTVLNGNTSTYFGPILFDTAEPTAVTVAGYSAGDGVNILVMSLASLFLLLMFVGILRRVKRVQSLMELTTGDNPTNNSNM